MLFHTQVTALTTHLLYFGPRRGQKRYQCFTLTLWWAVCPFCSSRLAVLLLCLWLFVLGTGTVRNLTFVEGLRVDPVGPLCPISVWCSFL